MAHNFHVRSISMPSKPHPAALRVEEELCKLRTFTASSTKPTSSMTMATACGGLRDLGDLYSHIQDLLHLSSNKQAILHANQKKLLEEQVDQSIRLLDLCGATKDALATLKERVQGLQSAVRRGRADSATIENVHAYIRARKEARKIIQRCYKEIRHANKSAPSINVDSDLFQAIKMVNGAREIAISLLCSTLSFMSTRKPKQKDTRWTLVSKATHKRKVACEEDSTEIGCLDVSLFTAKKDADSGSLLMVQNQLEALDINLGSLESGLECLFRGLIQSRVALLNILSL